jgi:hypothetical protein
MVMNCDNHRWGRQPILDLKSRSATSSLIEQKASRAKGEQIEQKASKPVNKPVMISQFRESQNNNRRNST